MFVLTPEQHTAYARDGFLLVKRMYDRQKVEELKAFFGTLAARRDTLPPAKFILEPNAPADAPPLARVRKINLLQEHDEMLPFYGPQSPAAIIAGQIMGERDLLFSCSSFTKPAGHGSQTPWHQDQALWAIWLREAVSCWVALDNSTRANGCLQFVRASHRDGFEPHVSTTETDSPHIPGERVDPERVAMMEMEPGDGVFFSGLTWHYSDPNRSDERRIGMTAVFNSVQDHQRGRDIIGWANNRIAGFGGGSSAQLKDWIKRPLRLT